jgi:hypothetical protein
MDTVLTLSSLVSFFGLVLAWATLPHNSSSDDAHTAARLADATH